jgi:RimJ/RimL family protein N-acetyltransferase
LKTKQSVVTYVARDNQAAAKVYNRVGFIKLNEIDRSAGGIEPWLEVGFDRDMVKLGHW